MSEQLKKKKKTSSSTVLLLVFSWYISVEKEKKRTKLL